MCFMFLKDLILISSGSWNARQQLMTARQAQRLRVSGVKIYAFGIGTTASAKQLAAVASKPYFAFTLKSYGNLDQEKDPLVHSMVFGGRLLHAVFFLIN
jgi:hypothetical protein